MTTNNQNMARTSKICRLCMLNDGKSLELDFPRTITSEIADRIRSVTHLSIFEEDGLPGTACQKCIFQLDMAYTFIQCCISSDRVLRSLQLEGTGPHTSNVLRSDGGMQSEEMLQTSDKEESVSINKRIIKVEVLDNLEPTDPECSPLAYITDDYTDDNSTLQVKGSSDHITAFKEEGQDNSPGSSMDVADNNDDKPVLPSACVEVQLDGEALNLAACSTRLTPEQSLLVEFKCHLCPQKFHTKKDLKKHLSNYSEARPFQCDNSINIPQKLTCVPVKDSRFKCSHSNCDKTFTRKISLIQHERKHSHVGKHKCGRCERSFHQVILLRNHMLIHN